MIFPFVFLAFFFAGEVGVCLGVDLDCEAAVLS
jgi:hypothetical protein